MKFFKVALARWGKKDWVVASVGVLLLATAIYYLIQSQIDQCFNLAYFLVLLAGLAFVICHLFLPFLIFLPLAGASVGVAAGIMIHDTLPSLSDVWNHVHFIGGDLTAYLIYSGVTLVSALILIVFSFMPETSEIPAKSASNPS